MNCHLRLVVGKTHTCIGKLVIIIFWFGDTVTVLHLTNCNTNSKVQAMSAYDDDYKFIVYNNNNTLQPHL